ncbi:MAG: hypothetical protein BGO21_20640 [Dyadobacter sp. 50-39]|nr:MAG: hypothetical protein BGO21_20640 [Dyadobacter sp. 50-39]
MNEDATRDLVKAGIKYASDDFTRELMRRIEVKQALRRDFTRAFKMGCGCCVLILILLVAHSNIVSILSIHFHPLYIKLAGAIIVFGLLNRLISIKEMLTAS